jgi:hypothetical protein
MVSQDGAGDVVLSRVGLKAERQVGLDRVGAVILQRIGFDLVAEANAPTLLAQVNHQPRTLGTNALKGELKLFATIAFE